MLTLGRRNDDSLARELEWFLSAEQNEITPASVWVLDDDETIRRRKVRVTGGGASTAALDGDAPQVQEPQVLDDTADQVQEPQVLAGEVALTDLEELPKINPHVSVQDEDSFAKPVALPEINPHVSVRDEDSFAKPVPLPEINPHVSIRDEDSFAKPVALPQIDPHVSVRDEDSFAKPLPLPEIDPHVSISDDAPISSPNSHASSHSIDEPQPPAGEPAYVRVSDGKKEKTFVQEYVGLSSSRSVVSSRAEDELRPLETEPGDAEVRPVVSSRVQKFDELRPVTKPKVHDLKPSRLIVNFPVQEKPPAVTPPVQHAPQPVVTPLVQNDPRPVVTPLVQSEPLSFTTRPVKLLDESQVLPGEASFATAIPNDSIGGHAHSPLHEFQAKTNLSLKTLLLASLLFVSIVAVSALVIVEATTGIFTSPQVAGSGESSASEPARPEILNGAKSVSPPVVSPPPKQETKAVASPREYPKFPSGATARFPSESVQSTSRGTARDSNKNSDSSRNLRGTVHGRENSKTARANAKESGAKKPTNSKRSDVNKAHSKTGVSRSASNSGKDNAGVRIKVEVKTPTPPNANGAQRPRTVTRRNPIPGI
ncbi:MAG TPA: hypothetical protein VJM12_10105 [Pyrinomonadaceae bacterium]|nr:hypothetical protein [Pyrinomonadaceae bacterium]